MRAQLKPAALLGLVVVIILGVGQWLLLEVGSEDEALDSLRPAQVEIWTIIGSGLVVFVVVTLVVALLRARKQRDLPQR